MKRKGYKYRIYPNEIQEIVIHKTFGCTRQIHNLLLNEKEVIYALFKNYPELLHSHTYLTNVKMKVKYYTKYLNIMHPVRYVVFVEQRKRHYHSHKEPILVNAVMSWIEITMQR